jgi:RNA polymerase sigma-70 factor (sigma-E family)
VPFPMAPSDTPPERHPRGLARRLAPVRLTPGRDKPSLDELYTAERLHMVRLALLLVDDLPTAEDVVQDAFSGMVRAWDELLDGDALRAYLRTCVVNGARSVLRRRRTARAYVPPLQPAQPGADDTTVLAEEHREAIVALGELPDRQREVLVLRYWSELSEADIAETLGISKGTVKSSASRGLAALRAALAGGCHD